MTASERFREFDASFFEWAQVHGLTVYTIDRDYEIRCAEISKGQSKCQVWLEPSSQPGDCFIRYSFGRQQYKVATDAGRLRDTLEAIFKRISSGHGDKSIAT